MRRNKEIYDVGIKVVKISGKPFKSTFKVGTICGYVEHPYVEGKLAYVMDDGSYVDTEFVEEYYPPEVKGVSERKRANEN